MPTRMPLTLLAIGAAGLLSACAGTPHQASLTLPAAPKTLAQAETGPAPLATPVAPLAAPVGLAADTASATDAIALTTPPEPSSLLPTASAGPALDIGAEVASAADAVALPALGQPQAQPRIAFSGQALDVAAQVAAEVADANTAIKLPERPAESSQAIALKTLEHPKVELELASRIQFETLLASSSVRIALAETAQHDKLAELAAANPAPAPARKLPAVPPLPTGLAMDLTPASGTGQSVASAMPVPAPVPPAHEETVASVAPKAEQVAEAAPQVTPRKRPHHRVAEVQTQSTTGEGGPDIPLSFELRR